MKTRRMAVGVLRVLLGLFFILVKTVQLFDRIGWGQWFRYFTGAIVLAGGALILLRLRWTFLGGGPVRLFGWDRRSTLCFEVAS